MPFILDYGIWGRSMGAFTALKAIQNKLHRQYPIFCLILDSPFTNL
jgi:hypothetical protein